MAVLTQRLMDGGGGGGDGLYAIVARLDGELTKERHEREAMEARVAALEMSVVREHEERESQLQGFSGELEQTMREIIARVDEGLSAGAQAMRERSDQTEERLRALIQRVDEGLSASAAALQDTLSSAGQGFAAGQQQTPSHGGGARHRQRSPARACAPSASSEEDPPGCEASARTSDQLIESWDRLRQENLALREQRALLSRARSPARARAVVQPCVGIPTPYPGTLQAVAPPGQGAACPMAARVGPAPVAMGVAGHAVAVAVRSPF